MKPTSFLNLDFFIFWLIDVKKKKIKLKGNYAKHHSSVVLFQHYEEVVLQFIFKIKLAIL